MTFRYLPIDDEIAGHIRAMLRDDAGNALEIWTAQDDGNPCRSCLRVTRRGERLILFALRPFTTDGPYAETGPVFVHAEPCEPYERIDEFPADFRARTLTFRAYDTRGRIDDAAVADGVDAERTLERLFAPDDVAVVHVRNPAWGCYDFRVVRGD
ncbi:MAG TPA: DUF1203 domain-containing protein [Candidatus Limnocylindria bacterium]|jgi:hypothetical protein|nr:DUF1203 domain-containing protein [Candidatus Limnocylindria bacterium]